MQTREACFIHLHIHKCNKVKRARRLRLRGWSRRKRNEKIHEESNWHRAMCADGKNVPSKGMRLDEALPKFVCTHIIFGRFFCLSAFSSFSAISRPFANQLSGLVWSRELFFGSRISLCLLRSRVHFPTASYLCRVLYTRYVFDIMH